MSCHTKRRQSKKGRGSRRRKMRMRGGFLGLERFEWYNKLFGKPAEPVAPEEPASAPVSEGREDASTEPAPSTGTGGSKKRTKHHRHKKNKAKKSMKRRRR